MISIPAESLLNGFVCPPVCLSFCNYVITTEEIFEKSEAERLKKLPSHFNIWLGPGSFKDR
jgi:hypothetical protein